VVDASRAQLDRERDRSCLSELVAVKPEREACVSTGLEVTPRLRRVEGAALEEDVGRRCDAAAAGRTSASA
jgi:hypothetical protein